MDTIYAGGTMDTIYAGGSAIGGVSPGPKVYGAVGQNVGRIVTASVINPKNRRPVSVTYDRQTNKYMDRRLGRWINAPGWMRNQFR